MAKKEYICTGGCLKIDGKKLQHINPGTIVEIDEAIGDKCRLLKAVAKGKKVTVATPSK